MDKLLKNKSKEISTLFLDVANQGCIKTLNYKIDISLLNIDYASQTDITKDGDFVNMFKELKIFQDYPALYYFKVNPDIDGKIIVDAIDLLNSTELKYSSTL